MEMKSLTCILINTSKKYRVDKIPLTNNTLKKNKLYYQTFLVKGNI